MVKENNDGLSQDDLMRLDAKDLLASRVFEDDANGGGETGKKDVE